MHKLTAYWLVICLSLVPSAVLTAQYDGSVPLLCAVFWVRECEAGAECHQGDAESVNSEVMRNQRASHALVVVESFLTAVAAL